VILKRIIVEDKQGITIMEFFNPGIAANPVNWFTVLFMLIIFAMAADLLLRHYGDLNWLASPTFQGN
jgi:hypothetical protein